VWRVTVLSTRLQLTATVLQPLITMLALRLVLAGLLSQAANC
jgi:hypothetical protein